LPVIVSNKVGCSIDLVAEDVNGIIFDLDDTYPITDEKFIDIPQILRQLIRDDKLNSLYL
jgi:heat shock protein HspQ